MKTVYAPSLGLPQGFKVSQFETLKEVLASAGTEEKVVTTVNLYLRQKDATVKARNALAKRLEETYEYPRKTKVVGEGDKKKTVPSEPEAQYIDRFIADAATGKIAKFKATSEEDALTKLQADADKLGPFVLTAAAPVRQPGKAAKLPAYAIDGAKRIIENDAGAKWKATFKKENIPFGDWETQDAEANIQVLARAIQARQKAKEAKDATTYA